MPNTASDRLRLIREMMGLTRNDFAEILDMDVIRLRNVELGRTRVTETEFEKIGTLFPELLHWLAYEGPIEMSKLKSSKNNLLGLMAALIEAKQIPEGMDESKII